MAAWLALPTSVLVVKNLFTLCKCGSLSDMYCMTKARSKATCMLAASCGRWETDVITGVVKRKHRAKNSIAVFCRKHKQLEPAEWKHNGQQEAEIKKCHIAACGPIHE
jgi:hypothetical protein